LLDYYNIDGKKKQAKFSLTSGGGREARQSRMTREKQAMEGDALYTL
jgi:hypothetical protein